MKHLLGTIAVLVFVAAVTGFVCYRLSADPVLHDAAAKGDAMAWLRTDFHLTDAQFAAIKRLHEAYAPSCAEHCRLIQAATKARDAVRAADPATVVAAERKLQELRATCETAIGRHVRQVAAEMSPADGARYLALVLPKISDFDHLVAPDLRLNPTH
ncbi:MAG: hypothetical protein HYV75_05995 [Opitutae bacterium]|nr:hypothetical protein [Opitutae bacterium]